MECRDFVRRGETSTGRLLQGIVWSLALAGIPGLAAAVDLPWTGSSIVASGVDGAVAMAWADLDGSGSMDVVVAAETAGSLTWWSNSAGDGSSWVATTIDAALMGANSVATDDLDEDGDLDVLGTGQAGVFWWENTAGDASTWQRRTVAGGTTVQSVSSADVDADGDRDVVGVSPDADRITMWRNDGSGTWTAVVVDAAFVRPVHAGLEDLDVDGRLDVVAVSADGQLAWWSQPPGGGAWLETTIGSESFGDRGRVATADIDRDGDLDVVVAAASGGALAWWRNDDGIGGAWTRQLVTSQPTEPTGIAVVDVDGDGDPDLTVADTTTGQVQWWENVGGDGSAWTARTVGTLAGAVQATALDLDGDGDRDLMAVGATANAVTWWNNVMPHRGVAFGAGAPIDPALDGAVGLQPIDLDVDGDLDVVSAATTASQVAWHSNDLGDGSAWTTRTIDTSFVRPHTVAEADFDRDGDLDLVTAGFDDTTIGWLENLDGRGGAWSRHVVDPSFSEVLLIDTPDLDGDGDPDIVAGSCIGDEVAWWDNVNGDGTSFVRRLVSTAVDCPTTTISTDLDRDGDLDLVASGFRGDTISWLENVDGVGQTWTNHVIATDFRRARWADAGDFDGDGDLDVVGMAQVGDDVHVWLNALGDQSVWTEVVISNVAFRVRQGQIADLDRDGDLDVVAAVQSLDAIQWFENRDGLGTSWGTAEIGTMAGVFDAKLGDLDGDGDLDAVGASTAADLVQRWAHVGGHVVYPTTAQAAPVAVAGSTASLFRVAPEHSGQAGDLDIALRGFVLSLEQAGSGQPLTSVEANQLFDALAVHLDSPGGVPGVLDDADPRIGSTVGALAVDPAGRVSIPLSDDLPEATLAVGQTATVFLVADWQPDAAGQQASGIVVRHRTADGPVGLAEPVGWDVPLALTSTPDQATQPIHVALFVDGFESGDTSAWTDHVP